YVVHGGVQRPVLRASRGGFVYCVRQFVGGAAAPWRATKAPQRSRVWLCHTGHRARQGGGRTSRGRGAAGGRFCCAARRRRKSGRRRRSSREARRRGASTGRGGAPRGSAATRGRAATPAARGAR